MLDPQPVDTGTADTGQACETMLVAFFDADGDGHGDSALRAEACELPPGHVLQGDDCDDMDASVFPGAEERCNQRDDDCGNEEKDIQ